MSEWWFQVLGIVALCLICYHWGRADGGDR